MEFAVALTALVLNPAATREYGGTIATTVLPNVGWTLHVYGEPPVGALSCTVKVREIMEFTGPSSRGMVMFCATFPLAMFRMPFEGSP